MKRITKSLPFKLLLGVCIGIIVGLLAGEGLMNIIVTVKYILGQYINFCVPLIVIGFIAPSIPKLGNNASKMLAVALVIAYAPCHLIVSGSRAPHIPEPEPLHHLQDVDFIEAMKRYSGMSKEFLENRDLLNLFLPIFRADFILDETYCFTKYEKFDFPITALYGDQDQDSEIDTVEAWSEYTNTSFNKKVFHGEHFFIKTSEKEVLAYIKDIVSRYV